MNIFTLFGEILIKDNGAKQKLEEINSTGEKVSSGLSSAFGKIGSTALKVGGIIGAGLGLHAMLGAAEGAQQKLSQMDAVLASTHGVAGMTKEALLKLADAQSRVTTFSKGTNLATENLLLTFTKIGSSVFPQALQAVNDMSQALGTDTKESAIQLGKALNNPLTGITALQRVGVTFTAGQKEQIAAMMSANNVAGAQGVILQELQKEFGGSAEAAGKTFAGQLTILKNQIAGVGGSIASLLMPSLTNFMSSVSSHLPQIQSIITNAINTAKPYVTDIIKDVGQIASNLLPNLGSSTSNVGNIVKSVVAGGFNAFKTVLDWIAQHGNTTKAALVAIASGFATLKIITTITKTIKDFSNGMNLVSGATGIVSRLGTAFMELRTAPTILTGIKGAFTAIFGVNPMILAVVAGIALLAAGAYLIVTHWTQVKTFFTNLWTGVKQKFTAFWNWLKPFMAQWGPIILTVIAPFIGIPLLIAQHWTQIKTTLANIWNGIKATASSIFNGIASFFASIWNAISNTFNTVITSIVNFVTTNFSGVFAGIQTIFNGIQTFFTGAWEAIKATFLGAVLIIMDLVTGNFTKLSQDAKLIWTDLQKAFSDIWNGIKEIFSGALQAIEAYYTTIFNAMVSFAVGLWNGFTSFLSNLWTSITNIATNAWNSLKSAVTSIITAIVSTAQSIWNGLLNWFASLPGRLYSLGVSIFDSMKNGVSSALSTLGSVVQNGFNSAISFITNLPSEAVKWGSDFIDGLINGITSKVGSVGNAVSNVASTIRSFLHFSVPDQGPLKLAA